MPAVPILAFHNQCQPTMAQYPPMNRRAQLKDVIKSKQEEQSDLQRGILADMPQLTEEELERRYAKSEALDQEIDQLLAEYKALSAALGIQPTPRPTPRQPAAAAPPPSTPPPRKPITRPPGAVKGGGVKNTEPRNAYVEALTSMTQWTPLQPPKMPLQPPKPTTQPPQPQPSKQAQPLKLVDEKTAVHVNPLATSMQAMSVGVMNI